MATFTLQSLELRAALLAGARATSQEKQGTRSAVLGNPAQVLSLPWQPKPGHPCRIGPERREGHRIHAERMYSMDTLGRRAGRSAGSAGAPGCSVVARLASRTILSRWSVKPVVAKTLCG